MAADILREALAFQLGHKRGDGAVHVDAHEFHVLGLGGDRQGEDPQSQKAYTFLHILKPLNDWAANVHKFRI
jgi:hypothetical protein